MLSKRHSLCSWPQSPGEEYRLKWDIIEQHLEEDQYQWFFQQPLHRVQLILEDRRDSQGHSTVTLVAEFFDLDLEQEYSKRWS